MRYIKKIVLVGIAVLIAVQVPFVYRRYQLSKVAEKIAAADQDRQVNQNSQFDEYKGVIHAHTNLGGHSTGSFDELISGANAADLDFVLMTEHWSDDYDTSALTLNGKYGKTLFVGGNEIDTADGDRFLMIPGSAEAAGLRKLSTTAVIDKLHTEQRLALITYPEKYQSWNAEFDGVEVFSLHTAGKQMNWFTAFFDVLWSGKSYPELTFAQYFRRPDSNLARYDEAAVRRKTSLVSGTDAHSNIGFHLLGDDSGNKLLNFKIDSYKFSYSIVRTHILLAKGTPVSREAVIDAVRAGRFFTGFEAFGDTTGFSFTCGDKAAGDEVSFADGSNFKVVTPIKARIVTFKNGVKFDEQMDVREVTVKPNGVGAYRVEVYRDDLGEPFSKMPWIISNPIYIR